MSTLTCQQTQLVKSLELVDEVRDTLAVPSNEPATPAHETAVISAAALAQALEVMIVQRDSELTANGSKAVVCGL